MGRLPTIPHLWWLLGVALFGVGVFWCIEPGNKRLVTSQLVEEALYCWESLNSVDPLSAVDVEPLESNSNDTAPSIKTMIDGFIVRWEMISSRTQSFDEQEALDLARRDLVEIFSRIAELETELAVLYHSTELDRILGLPLDPGIDRFELGRRRGIVEAQVQIFLNAGEHDPIHQKLSELWRRWLRNFSSDSLSPKIVDLLKNIGREIQERQRELQTEVVRTYSRQYRNASIHDGFVWTIRFSIIPLLLLWLYYGVFKSKSSDGLTDLGEHNALFDVSRTGTMVFNYRGELIRWNDLALRYIGYEETHPKNERILEQFLKLFSPSERSDWEECRTTGVLFQATVRKQQSNNYHSIHIRALPFESEKKQCCAVSLQDITQEHETIQELLKRMAEADDTKGRLEDQSARLSRQAEELESAKQEAETAARLKTEFLANMSHEIRTPMTAILGFSEVLLQSEEKGGEEVNRVELLNTIQRNGEHLLGLINDILDVSKIESGRMTTEMIACEPLAIVQDVYELLINRAKDKNIELLLEVTSKIPTPIQTDPTRLKQILVNLVGNAIKFTSQGWVRISVRVNAQQTQMVFSVSDTGLGMSPEELKRLFRPFTQADSSTTRKFGGTGLGLTISKTLANLLGGDITVDTVAGCGSTFHASIQLVLTESSTWDLPKGAATTPIPESAPTPRKLEGGVLKGVRILLAEDGPDNQKLITFHLKKAGAEVTIVENGLLALEALRSTSGLNQSRFDILLLDMMMPVMDGYTTAKTLREEGNNLPIIALTALAMSTDRQRCLDVGCTDYASKPINSQKLIELIHHHVKQHVAVVAQ